MEVLVGIFDRNILGSRRMSVNQEPSRVTANPYLGKEEDTGRNERTYLQAQRSQDQRNY